MKKNCLILLIVVFTMLSCASNTTKNITAQQQQDFDDLINSEKFEIVFVSAHPMANTGMQAVANAGLLAPGSNLARIDLLGNPNYMRRVGDSVSASLPYYGERQIGGAYNNSKDAGINYDGTPKELTVAKNEKNGSYNMSYSIKNNTENFVVNGIMFPNGTASATITSSHRRTISYRGRVGTLRDNIE